MEEPVLTSPFLNLRSPCRTRRNLSNFENLEKKMFVLDLEGHQAVLVQSVRLSTDPVCTGLYWSSLSARLVASLETAWPPPDRKTVSKAQNPVQTGSSDPFRMPPHSGLCKTGKKRKKRKETQSPVFLTVVAVWWEPVQTGLVCPGGTGP